MTDLCETKLQFTELDESTIPDTFTENSVASLRKGKRNVESVTTMFLDRIRKDPNNVYITVTEQLAREQAATSATRILAGTPLPLEGVQFAIKDNFCTKGIRTTAASKMLSNFIPTYESTVTQRLLDAGAVVLGKTNMDEFAMGSSTESSFFKPTTNPVARKLGLSDRVPGGSSGGSAAAVAGGLAAASLGTDTGGSIRQPASLCGLVGFKPTYGVCSRWGVIAYASSLDQPGVIAKSVQDVAIVMDVIGGSDEKDTTSIPNLNFQFEKIYESESTPKRIGVVKELFEKQSTVSAKHVMQKFMEMCRTVNIDVVEVSLPTFHYALPTYYIIALSEASSNLARYDGVRYGHRSKIADDIDSLYEHTRAEGFGGEVIKRIILGTYSLSAGHMDQYYGKAQLVRQKLSNEWKSAFHEVDAIAMPTTPTGAFEIGEFESSSLEMYLQDLYTVPINLAGLPAITIPVAKDVEGLPLGLQLIGPQLADAELIRLAATMEIAEALAR